MAKFTFNDILTKVSNVFKTDMYIIDYQFCLGGKESENDNKSLMMCVLTPDLINLVKETFPDNKNIFFTNVKKAKDELQEYSTVNINKDILKNITEKRDEILKKINNVKSWNSFGFTEETIDDIFKEGGSLELFKDNKDIPSVTITKTLFPLVTNKCANELYYNLIKPKEDNEIYELVTSFDTDWFQIYNIIQYLNIDN